MPLPAKRARVSEEDAAPAGLVQEGATLVVLGVPPGTEFGVDLNSWNTGEKFCGVKLIPPGLHFVYYSSVHLPTRTTGPRTGWFHSFGRSELVVKRWSTAGEEVVDSTEEEVERVKAVKVRTGQRKCKESTSKLGHVYQCFGCESLAFQPLGKTSLSKDGTNLKFSLPHGPPVDRNCKFCSHSHHIGGPIWLAPIHNTKFVKKLLDSLPCHLGTIDRLVGMLSMVLEELEDVPLYYELTRVCNITKQSCGGGGQ